tara:strand:- start:324 stop:518 length:195 start_codon:yes stop_codon:yes gene_type:complete
MQKPDPLICGKPGAEDLTVARNRVQWLEMLYFYEGRDNVDHPQRGLYTGLFKKHHLWSPGSDED